MIDKWRGANGWRARTAAAVLALALPACDDATGACVAIGGGSLFEVCIQDVTEAECRDRSSSHVGGADWLYYDGKSCVDVGYSQRCPNGYYRSSC